MNDRKYHYYADLQEDNKYYLIITENGKNDFWQEITMEEYREGMLLICETLDKYSVRERFRKKDS